MQGEQNLTFLTLCLLLFFNCNGSKGDALLQPILIVPQPTSVKASNGSFLLNEKVEVAFIGNLDSNHLLPYLNSQIKPATGFQLKQTIDVDNNSKKIVFEETKGIKNKEGYHLSIRKQEIRIKSASNNGAFYAIQSLLQLLPNAIFGSEQVENIKWELPAVEITDQPRFSYRGMHLDVCRHFFPVDVVKKYIDLMALHKYNHFHWHLTEDQGWRIEIKKYPKLTEVGGYRDETLVGHYNDQPHKFDATPHQGFYTQSQIKEIVQYAADRYITVVPEIELPGHAQAAIAAYPELSCTKQQLQVMKIWGISEEVFCPTEFTFTFLENVLDEVVDLFPGKYIHIGGDECPKVRWKESAFCQALMKEKGLKDEQELQSYFIQRIEQYLNKKGKQIIGWDEILEGGLAPNATVMSWRGNAGGIEAAKQGHDVVMTPTSHCYFDYYQTQHKDAPLAIGGYLPIEKVYSYEPIPSELPQEMEKHILGAQCNLWTEYIKDEAQLFYMAYPRATALAEVLWSQKDSRDFELFMPRLLKQMERLEQKNINIANHIFDVASTINPTGNGVSVDLYTLSQKADIYLTTDGSKPTRSSTKYETSLEVKESTKIKALPFKDGKIIGLGNEIAIEMHLAAGKSIQLKDNPNPKYAAGGNDCLINGVKGNSERYGDAEWLGFDGKNVEAIIDLKKEENLKLLKLRFFNAPGQWIRLPRSIHISISNDQKNYTEIAQMDKISGKELVMEYEFDLKNKKSQYVKIEVERFGIIPEGGQGAGNEAWLFIDEIVME